MVKVTDEGSERDTQFLSFDWTNSEAWQLYLSNLYPTPPAAKIINWKKKWYQKNIDTEFNLCSSVGEESTSTTTASEPSSSSSSSSSSPSQTNRTTAATPAASAWSGSHTATAYNAGQVHISQRLCSAARLVAVVLSLLCVLPMSPKRFFFYAAWVHVCSNVAAIVVKYGLPKFDMAWMQPVMTDDSSIALFFSMAAFSLAGNTLALFSPSITAILGLSESYSTVIQPHVPDWLHRKLSLSEGTRYVNATRYSLMQFRANIEVMLGIVSLILIFFGRTNLLSVLLYWNAVRSAYQVSGFTQSTFTRLNVTVSKFLQSTFLPSFVFQTYTKVVSRLYNYATPPDPRQAS